MIAACRRWRKSPMNSDSRGNAFARFKAKRSNDYAYLLATLRTEQKYRDRFASFANEHVKRSCRRSVIHRFDADAPFQEFGHHVLRRKVCARTGAEQNDFRFKCKNSIDGRIVQRLGI